MRQTIGLALLVICITVTSLCLLSQQILAEPPREYTDSAGNKVREYRDVVKRQVWETEYKDQTQTIQRPKLETEYQPQVRQYQVPITEWVLVPEIQNRWNPFATPQVQYRYQQRTRYELRQDTVQVPVLKQQMVNEQQTIKVPQLVQREVEEEIIRKVVVRDLPAAATQNSQLVQLPQTGVAAPLVQQSTPRATNPAPLVQTPHGVRQLPYGAASPAITMQQQPANPSLSNPAQLAQRPDPFAQPSMAAANQGQPLANTQPLPPTQPNANLARRDPAYIPNPNPSNAVPNSTGMVMPNMNTGPATPAATSGSLSMPTIPAPTTPSLPGRFQ